MGMKDGWKHTTIGEMIQEKEVSIQTGPFGTVLSASEYIKFGIPVISVREVRQGYIELFDETPSVSNETYNKMPQFRLYPDDLVFARKGSVDRSALIPNDGKKYFLGSDGIRLRFNNPVLAKILLYSFQSAETKQFLLNSAYGTTMAGLNETIISQIPVSFPIDEKEQQSIAIALSDIDKETKSMEKLIAKKKAIKQGAMQLLLTGKNRLLGFTTEWKKIRFGDYCNIVRGGSPRPIQDYISKTSEGVNWIKIGDVDPEDKYIESTQEKIIEEGIYRSRFVRQGDFILSNSMSFGRPYILKIDGCIHDGWLAIQNYQETFSEDFLYYTLSSDYVYKQYIQMAAGSSVQNLNKEKVQNLFLYLPEKKEQAAISNALSDIDNEIVSLMRNYKKKCDTKQGMMQQLLTGKIRLM